MTDQLAELLDQYLESNDAPPAYLDNDGVFTIETKDGLSIGAAMLEDGRLELFGNPGYVSADTLESLADDDDDEDEDEDIEPTARGAAPVPGALVRWKTDDDAHWGIHVHRDSGLVTLTELVPELPWHPDGLAERLTEFCREHASWAARLQSGPPGEADEGEDDIPPAGLQHHALVRG